MSSFFDLIRLPKKSPFHNLVEIRIMSLRQTGFVLHAAHSLTIQTSSSQAHTHCFIIPTQKDGNNNVLGKELSPIDVIALRYSLHMLLLRFETIVCLPSSQL